MGDRNEGIIKKIKGLLAIANDNKNDEESQSAFMMAQKLMMKYDITMGQVDSEKDNESIEQGQVTVYKKLFWWERKLAQIISKNFRVKFFYNNRFLKGQRNIKRAIVFLGFEKDVELAKEMYILAYDVLTFYSKRFIEDQYEDSMILRSHRITADYKNSYMRGFLEGMAIRFEEQVQKLQQEYGLMVLLPPEVQNAYDEMFRDTKGISFQIPPIGELQAHHRGYSEGKKVDYTKSTIDDGLGDLLVE
ncbi:DUF2786 domain-containing protein [Heyndrickxia oleronia]|uniref:DUF2786 domain-containing protein n=1 Tax=Heyndrickxia oleronia TaxID=38875 RepID=UPI00333A9F79